MKVSELSFLWRPTDLSLMAMLYGGDSVEVESRVEIVFEILVNLFVFLKTSVMYYKHITIVNDDSSNATK
jgi:hypothetical protein